MFWGLLKSRSNDEKVEQIKGFPEENLPDDLKEYLNEKTDSGLSDRKFKKRMQSTSVVPQDYSDIDKGNDNETGKIETTTASVHKKVEEKSENSIPRGKLGPSQLMKRNIQTTERLSQEEIRKRREFEEYMRRNNLEESVNINCIDFRNQFAKCIEESSRLDMFKCLDLEDFFANCVKLQRKSFKSFNYNSMTSVDELETIKYEVDRSFNKYFHENKDTTNSHTIAQYEKELNHKRELFYNKYGK